MATPTTLHNSSSTATAQLQYHRTEHSNTTACAPPTVAAAAQGGVCVFHLGSCTKVATLAAHSKNVRGLAYDAEHNLLLTCRQVVFDGAEPACPCASWRWQPPAAHVQGSPLVAAAATRELAGLQRRRLLAGCRFERLLCRLLMPHRILTQGVRCATPPACSFDRTVKVFESGEEPTAS